MPPWVPHVAPYVAFLLAVTVQSYCPEPIAAWLGLARVGLPLSLLVIFAARGCYPELRGLARAAGGHRAIVLDVLVGLAVAGMWIAPYLLFPGLPRPSAGAHFDPDALGAALRPALLAVRVTGFALVTPFVEELFVRSFLLRAIDAGGGGDFRALPIGRFAWASFLGTVIYFTCSHATWEWPVALPTGIAFNLWLYRRRHLGASVTAHAVANLSIFLLALLGPVWLPGATDLWFFL